jgi:hypothetical protein
MGRRCGYTAILIAIPLRRCWLRQLLWPGTMRMKMKLTKAELEAKVKRLQELLAPFADRMNWEYNEVYGPYGSYYETQWVGGDRPIEDAREEMNRDE